MVSAGSLATNVPLSFSCTLSRKYGTYVKMLSTCLIVKPVPRLLKKPRRHSSSCFCQLPLHLAAQQLELCNSKDLLRVRIYSYWWILGAAIPLSTDQSPVVVQVFASCLQLSTFRLRMAIRSPVFRRSRRQFGQFRATNSTPL